MRHDNYARAIISWLSVRKWKVMGVMPVAALFILMLIFNAQRSSEVFEAPTLLAYLNAIFVSVIPLIIAYMAAKSHRATGIFAFAMIGCGFVFFAVSNLYAGWLMLLAAGPNPNVTVHNLGALFAGLFQFIGSHFFMQELTLGRAVKIRLQRSEILYAVVFVLVSILAVLAFRGDLPVFFDPLDGPSFLRQFVLVCAIILFTITGFLFLEIRVTVNTDFAYWYGLALWSIALGLTCVLLQRGVGSPLGWTGRAAQYLGAIYFILAFLQGQVELPAADSSTSWALWPFLEQKITERTDVLMQTNQALQREIAERRQVEEHIVALSLRNKLLLETTSDGIHVLDEEGRVIEANPAFCTMLGYTREELSQLTVADWDAQWNGEQLMHKLREPIAQPALFETRYRCKDGTFREVEINSASVMLDGREHLYAAARDITARKRAEASLRESEERYSDLFNSMDEGLAINEAVFNENGDVVDYRILDVNPAFEIQSIYKTEDVLGKLATDVYKMSPEYISGWWKEHAQIQRVAHTDLYHEPSNRWFEITTTRPEGKRFATIFVDVTQRKLAEEARKLAELRYHSLFEQSHDAVFILDLEGNHLDANQRAADMLGYSISEIQKLSVEQTSAEIVESKNIIMQLRAGAVVPVYERLFRKKNGDVFPAEINTELVLDTNGQPLHIQSVVRDITSRKQAEDALRASENNLRRAQTIAHIGSWNMDIVRNTITCSPETYHIFGVPLETPLTYESFFQCIHPDDAELVDNAWQKALRGSQHYEIEHRVIVDGQVRWVQERAELESDASGNFLRGNGTVQDINERKLAELALHESEEKIRAIIEQSSEAISLIDEQGNVAEWNRANEQLTGILRDEVLGRPAWDVQFRQMSRSHRVHVTLEFLKQSLLKILETGQSPQFNQSIEVQIENISGTSRIVLQNAFPIKTAKGYRLGVIMHDITERKQMEERIRENEARLSTIFTASPVSIAISRLSAPDSLLPLAPLPPAAGHIAGDVP